MSEWRTVRLADVAELTVGFVGTMAKHYEDDGVPFLRSQNILPHRLDMTDIKYISHEFDSQIAKSRLRPGDVVTVRTGKPGTTCVIPSWLTHANCSDLVITRPHPELSARWFSYFMNSQASQHIDASTVGAVQQHFNVGAAKSLPILLPPLPEQQAIAEVLGALDDKIAANTKLAAIIDDYLAVAFSSIVLPSARPGTLNEIADVNTESTKPVGGGNLRYVDISSVESGRYTYPVLTEWSTAPGRARRVIHPGDTLWSTVRPGRRSHALNLFDDAELVGSTGLAVLSPTSTSFAYVYEAARRTEFSDYLVNVAEGSAYPAVRADRFRDAPVPIATASVMDTFTRVAEPLRQSQHSLETENLTLAATRDALLPRLMSGQLRVRDAEAIIITAGA